MTARLRILLITLATAVFVGASYVVAPTVAVIAELEPVKVCR